MKWNQDILNIPCAFFMVFAATFLMILSLSTGLTLSTWCKIIRASFILNGNECYKPNKYWIGAFYTEYTPTNQPSNQHTKYMQRIRNFSLVIADPGVNFRWNKLYYRFITEMNSVLLKLSSVLSLWNDARNKESKVVLFEFIFFCWSNQI